MIRLTHAHQFLGASFRLRRPLSVWLLLGLLSVSCSNSNSSNSDNSGSISSAVDAYIAESNRLTSVLCDCYAEFDYDSSSSCEADEGYIGPSERQCVIDALGQDAESARVFLDCVVPLERNYADCADERLDCSDLDTIEVCGDDYDVGFDKCIELPQAIQRDLEQCD